MHDAATCGCKWSRATRVGRHLEAELRLQLRYIFIHLPAGGAVHQRRGTEYLLERTHRQRELLWDHSSEARADTVLPLDVIVGVHAHLETLVLDGEHLGSATFADVRSWNQRTVRRRRRP